MIRLGVNIDHVATLRNARGEAHPNTVIAEKFIKKKEEMNENNKNIDSIIIDEEENKK